MFGFFKKKKPAAPEDPLVVFDRAIDSLDKQASEVRRSAVTLLALKGELNRDAARYQERLVSIDGRLAEAERVGDARAETTLRRDRQQAERLLEKTHEAMATTETDATLLKETAEQLAAQLSELQEERQSARARLKAGVLVTEAMKAQAAQFERVMKLDAARDEVEKAHALAELYREDVSGK